MKNIVKNSTNLYCIFAGKKRYIYMDENGKNLVMDDVSICAIKA